MPTLPVYLTTQEFIRLSELAASRVPSTTPESIGQEVLRSYLQGVARGHRAIRAKKNDA